MQLLESRAMITGRRLIYTEGAERHQINAEEIKHVAMFRFLFRVQLKSNELVLFRPRFSPVKWPFFFTGPIRSVNALVSGTFFFRGAKAFNRFADQADRIFHRKR